MKPIVDIQYRPVCSPDSDSLSLLLKTHIAVQLR